MKQSPVNRSKGEVVAVSRRWTGFRSVVCPVDFSEDSRLALRYAEAVAARGNAALTIVYANDPLLVAAAGAALRDRNLAKRSADELQRFIDRTLSPRARQHLPVRALVSTGEPEDQIMKAVTRAKCDLIVMGTHGLTGAKRLLIGSTTLSVLQRSAVPVLAVPRSEGNRTPDSWDLWPGRRIVAALELDDASDKDARVAAAIARWFGSSLVLVHVVTQMAAPIWLQVDLSTGDPARVAKARQQLDALAGRMRRRLKIDTQVLRGNVADEIAALAETERAGLVITALRDRRGWFGARRGSISYHVLSRAIAPVLALPPNWRCR